MLVLVNQSWHTPRGDEFLSVYPANSYAVWGTSPHKLNPSCLIISSALLLRLKPKVSIDNVCGSIHPEGQPTQPPPRLDRCWYTLTLLTWAMVAALQRDVYPIHNVGKIQIQQTFNKLTSASVRFKFNRRSMMSSRLLELTRYNSGFWWSRIPRTYNHRDVWRKPTPVIGSRTPITRYRRLSHRV